MSDAPRPPDPWSLDPETLAAFLEGRLEGEEREEVMAQLAASEGEFEIFADAAHVRAALEKEGLAAPPAAEDPPTNPFSSRGPGGSRSRPFRMRALPLGAAAAALLLAVGVWSFFQDGDDVPGSVPEHLVALLDESSLADTPLPSPGWTVTRSPGQTFDAEERAFRVGYLATRVEGARIAGEMEVSQFAVAELAELAAGFTGGGPVAALYRNQLLLEPGPDGERFRAEVWEATEGLAPVAPLRAGAYLAGAQMAAELGQREWFTSETARRIREGVTPHELPEEAREAWARLGELVGNGAVDAAALSETVDRLIRLLGG